MFLLIGLGSLCLFITWYLQNASLEALTPPEALKHQQQQQYYAAASRRDTPKFAPLQFKFEICNGLTNQKLQILDGALVGLFLGAQIIFPKGIVMNGAQFVSVSNLNLKPADHIFNMTRFEKRMQQHYADFWCRRPSSEAFRLWCSDSPPAAIVYDNEIPADAVQDVKLKAEQWGPEALVAFGNGAYQRIFAESRLTLRSLVFRIIEPCQFWFNVKVVEGTAFWNEFWRIYNALDFNDQILQLGESTKRYFLTRFGEAARFKAQKLGYDVDEEAIQYSGYHVVHLRAEQDWQEHCRIWASWKERRDNCFNNTWHIGNVLLSEGISPALPVYLATGLTESEVQDLRNIPSMRSFFRIYTVITKGMLGLTTDVGEEREYWAAVDFILGEDAEWFVGNSISTFSALMMEIRARRNMPSIPYNGGKMALEEIDCLRPREMILIPPVRPALKWLFTLPQFTKLHDAAYNTTMAALTSALAHTRLVPVCVTAADPYSPVVVRLASMGVRILYHEPTWINEANQVVEAWNLLASRSGFQYMHPIHVDDVMEKWIRMDIPVLGILDTFVLYTDSGVVFTEDVTWKDVLGDNHQNLARSMQRKMFSGPFFSAYATPGKLGVPRFFAVPDSGGGRHGIMFMNLKNLRDSYDVFRSFVLQKERLLTAAGGDPCSYLDFYDERSSLPSWVGIRSFASV
eukprot:Skav206304  [mRNA]  locus=scaffold4747:35467:37524:+ [translate_table: standard]